MGARSFHWLRAQRPNNPGRLSRKHAKGRANLTGDFCEYSFLLLRHFSQLLRVQGMGPAPNEKRKFWVVPGLTRLTAWIPCIEDHLFNRKAKYRAMRHCRLENLYFQRLANCRR